MVQIKVFLGGASSGSRGLELCVFVSYGGKIVFQMHFNGIGTDAYAGLTNCDGGVFTDAV